MILIVKLCIIENKVSFLGGGLKILEHLEKMVNSTSTDDLFNAYKKATSECGYDRIMYRSVKNDIENEQNKTPCLVQNYPEYWIKLYVKNGYIQIDPVRRGGCFATGPFVWESLKKIYKLSKKQELILSLSEEAGLHNGIGIPCHARKGEFIGVGIASSVKGNDPEEHIAKLYMLTTQFHVIYQDLLEKTSVIKNENDIDDISIIPLTIREQEVLLWSMKGKSNWDISVILNISEHAVDFHVRNILKKLNVNSKLSAVVKALYMGLIKL